MKYGGLFELHCEVNMERTAYSDTTAEQKWHLGDFLTPSLCHLLFTMLQ